MNFIQSKIGQLLVTLLMSAALSACATVDSPDTSSSASSSSQSTSVAENTTSVADNESDEIPSDVVIGESLADAETPNVVYNHDRNIFRVGDTAHVEVFGFEKLSGSHQINQTGTISMPLIGTVKAAGLSTSGLQNLLTARYASNYLQNPSINVVMDAKSFGKIIIDGAVSKPGVYEVDSIINFTEAIALAGGLNELGSRDEVFVIRVVDEERVIHTVDLASIQTMGAADPAIIPNDYIFVKDSQNKTTYNEIIRAMPLANTLALFGLF